MSEFDKREASFEGKFAHDEEIEFKARAFANRMLALWAGDKLGKRAPAIDDYARQLVDADIAGALPGGVQARILADFTAAGVAQSEHQIARTYGELHAAAIKVIMQK